MYPYPFAQSVSPAVRTHLDAQTAFMNDISKSFFNSFQQMVSLNIQLAQTMLEETTLAGQKVLSADHQGELLSAAAARTQPAADKLRAYQQHISRLAADAQVDLARVAEQHVQNTTRTARALADEVARTASEETERGLRSQQEALRQFSDPFERDGSAAALQSEGERAVQAAQHSSSSPAMSSSPAASSSSSLSSSGTQQPQRTTATH
ncbi:phasin family protein [Massilia sp. TN1-12]|uniref:phasin family protein n=1 Tax=Massilia paldalensis TaxID=3377675 RepID=UPI00384FD4C4